MNRNNLSFSEAKKIPIIDYLSGLGFEPAKIRGSDYWYHSPYREERTPSFKVNIKFNVWYDHGTSEGGTILDLGARLHQCTLHEFLEKLSNGNYQTSVSFHQQKSPIEKPENKLEVVSSSPLTSPDLLYYLRNRGIDSETARQYCEQIEFRIGTRAYAAIGFPNQSGGYELRNSWFKGSSSPKDISFIETASSKLCVLEGFIDFLSVLKINDREIKGLTDNSNYLILNSLRLLNRTLPILQSHREVNLFLDNDSAAKEAKDGLIEKDIRYHDASVFYAEHKDVNEYLVNKIRNKHVQGLSNIKPRGMRR